MTFVMTRLDAIQAGFNSCFIVRYLLEKANCTDHALTLLKELPVASNCNILIALRYHTVMASFNTHIKGNLLETTEQLLKGEYGFMCQYDDEPGGETVWSSLFDLKSLMIHRTEGDPRTNKFVMDSRLHDIVQDNVERKYTQ